MKANCTLRYSYQAYGNGWRNRISHFHLSSWEVRNSIKSSSSCHEFMAWPECVH